LKQFMVLLHGKPLNPAWELHITTGSQDALSKAVDALMEDGDSIIMGEPGYPGFLANTSPKRAHVAAIPMDADGLIVDEIERTLANWDSLYPGKRFPKLVYCVPVGCNPSGATMSQDRKVHLVRLASQYDLIILEDDPYYFLTLTEDTPEQLAAEWTDVKAWNAPESMYKLDSEGRVLRFESMSKVFAAGLRVGYVLGPTPLVMRIMLHSQASVLHCSTTTQMIVYTWLLSQQFSGLLTHVRKVRSLYRSQRDALLAALEQHLQGKCTWNVPTGGMFVWITTKCPDTFDLIMRKAPEAKVLFVPGQSFSVTNSPSNCVRASFSVVPPEQLMEGMRRLALLLDGAAEDAEKASTKSSAT